MSCSGAYADANDFGNYFCVAVEPEEEPVINRTLRLAASKIHAARAAQGACDCTTAGWVTDYLMELNIWLAVVVYNCKCSNLKLLTTDEKRLYLEATTADLELIRTGQIELCAGETGSDFPAISWAERSLTSFNTAEIIRNELSRRDA